MKNSSRLLAEMTTNFSRSSRGTLGSRASLSTRSLNSSHESSRLKNISGVPWARSGPWLCMKGS
jgi:hypothetical protein